MFATLFLKDSGSRTPTKGHVWVPIQNQNAILSSLQEFSSLQYKQKRQKYIAINWSSEHKWYRLLFILSTWYNLKQNRCGYSTNNRRSYLRHGFKSAWLQTICITQFSGINFNIQQLCSTLARTRNNETLSVSEAFPPETGKVANNSVTQMCLSVVDKYVLANVLEVTMEGRMSLIQL